MMHDSSSTFPVHVYESRDLLEENIFSKGNGKASQAYLVAMRLMHRPVLVQATIVSF